ncbi:hypothetical protein AAEP93_008081 [Penicillium crustosum]
MNLLDLPLEIIHLIFQSIPDQWGLYSLSSLQDPPNPRGFSLDLSSLNSFVQTCRTLYMPLNPFLYQWDAEFYSNRALRWAAESGNLATARLSLKARLPEEGCRKRWEYLYLATHYNQQAIVRLLLEHGIDPNRIAYRDTEVDDGGDQNNFSINLLDEAAYGGSVPILELLLDHGAVTDRLTFITMLEHAAGEGRLAIVKLLMENDCGLGVIDPAEYHDALCRAIEAGSTSVVRFLLEKGVCPEMPPGIQPPSRLSMALAAYVHDPEIVKMLLAHGANPFPEGPVGTNVLPLVNAARVKNYAVAQLLRESIDPEEMIGSRGRNQEFLLLAAAACGWDDMVRQLLDQGCLVDTKVRNLYSFNSTSKPDIDKQHLPAISLAADRGHYSTVQLLLSYNASCNPPSRYEEPFPLLHAVASGHLNIVELLLDHGAEPNGIGRWYEWSKGIGDLPCIYWALGHPKIFRFLLDRGADLSVPAVEAVFQIHRDIHGLVSISHKFEGGGRVPISTLVIREALKRGCTEIVQILLERGIPLQNPGDADCWGYKPLPIAATAEDEEMTRLILDHRFNLSSGSLGVEEAINIAVGEANFLLFKLLLDTGWLNSPSASLGDRNILGMEIPAPPRPRKDTNTDATVDLPTEHGTYNEPRESPLATSPLDHLFTSQAVSGPGNTDIFVQFLLEQGAEPLGGSSALMTPLGIASKRGYIHIVQLMLRVIDRQTITEEELLLKLGVILEIEPLDAVDHNSYAEYYTERSSRNLP